MGDKKVTQNNQHSFESVWSGKSLLSERVVKNIMGELSHMITHNPIVFTEPSEIIKSVLERMEELQIPVPDNHQYNSDDHSLTCEWFITKK